MKKRNAVRQDAQVRIHGGGVLTVAPTYYVPNHLPTGSRGKIKEWSKRSRMRLRRYLLEHEPARPSIEANVTLTVPGPPMSPEEMRALFFGFAREFQRRGWSAVWRLELQARGQPHWHLCVAVPLPPGGGGPEFRAATFFGIHDLWKNALESTGPVEHQLKGSRSLCEFANRWQIPGSDVHAVHVQLSDQAEGDRWAWRRYMQDHASKGKQEQIAVGYGRHWGVIGRKGYRREVPESIRLTDPQYFAFVRWSQRLISGTVKAPRAPFGRKRGKRVMRGTAGKSVWFSKPATMRRLIEHAKAVRP